MVQILWCKSYGAPKEVHSDEEVHIWSDTRWTKRLLDALNVHVTTGVPNSHKCNPLCERQQHPVEPNLRVLMKQECTKRLGTLVTLGCPNHELSTVFSN